MTLRPSLGCAGPPALWLPAPLPVPRQACPSSLLPSEGPRRGGGPADLLASESLTGRRSAIGRQISDNSASGQSCTATASSADDAPAANHARRRFACCSTATALRERPSAEATAASELLAQYPWPVDSAWMAAAAGSDLNVPPSRPSGATRRAVQPAQLASSRPAGGELRATPRAPAEQAANRQVKLQPPAGRSALRSQTDAARLAQTVR